MKYSFSTTFSYLLLFAFAAFAAPPSSQGYALTWSEEFNGAVIDINTWSFDTGCTYDDTYEYYSPGKNVTIENGAAVLEARKEPIRQRCGNYYTSCKMNTMGKAEFKYGYFEIRMKSPKGQGLVPEIWMMGSNLPQVAWPACGQIDFYDQRTGPQLYNGTPGDNCFTATCNFKGISGSADYNYKQYNHTECLCSDYHLYAIEWDSLKIQYFFDGNKFWEYDSICQSVNFATFHQPFFFVVNITVGGAYQGYFIDTTIFPQRMYIDYVRVYQKSTQVNVNSQKHATKGMTLANPSQTQLKVYNLQGRLIVDYTNRVTNMKPGENVIKGVASDLPIGIYAVRFFDGAKTVSEKLVIQK